MKTLIKLSAVCAAISAVVLSTAAQAQTVDPVVLTFSTVGDSRQDPAKVDSTQKPLTQQDYQWLQNSKAWSRIMREIGSKKANLLFFNGDMIMGYGNTDPANVNNASVAGVVNSDLVRYYTQSAFWRGMVAPLIESGTYVVPVAGNHEVQCRSGAVTTGTGVVASVTSSTQWANVTCKDVNGVTATGKLGMKVNEDAWRANFGDLIVDSGRMNAVLPNGLTVSSISGNTTSTAPGSADGLTTDQSKLSYSFDVGNSHFAIINTDPAGADSTAPANWLNADFSAAQARGAQHFFVFGHKPAYTYFYNSSATAGGLDANAAGTANRDAFWSTIESYGATYFCGHEHTFNMAQPVKKNADGTTTTSSAYQVLVGSGGSPFDAATLAAGETVTDRYYAYANVSVFQSGKVQIDAYGFSDTYGPTKLLQRVTLGH
ncbi:MAG: metallophosphoesterase [Burkholderiales bacterium]|nr:metallophosphoesterase [Burkholderiales bacterium]